MILSASMPASVSLYRARQLQQTLSALQHARMRSLDSAKPAPPQLIVQASCDLDSWRGLAGTQANSAWLGVASPTKSAQNGPQTRLVSMTEARSFISCVKSAHEMSSSIFVL